MNQYTLLAQVESLILLPLYFNSEETNADIQCWIYNGISDQDLKRRLFYIIKLGAFKMHKGNKACLEFLAIIAEDKLSIGRSPDGE